jgi:predicted CoA-binding protein
LKTSKTIAILGLSPKAERDSHWVGMYLKESGYRIIPVRPGQKEILGEQAHASLKTIDERVDVVDAFINPAKIVPLARDAVELKPNVFWMQLQIENQEAATVLTEAGIDVVMNRCMKQDHERFFKNVKFEK